MRYVWLGLVVGFGLSYFLENWHRHASFVAGSHAYLQHLRRRWRIRFVHGPGLAILFAVLITLAALNGLQRAYSTASPAIVIAFRFVLDSLVPLLSGAGLGILLARLVKAVSRPQGAAETVTALGTFAALTLMVFMMAKDPDASFLERFKSANFGGVSVEFSQGTAPARDADIDRGALPGVNYAAPALRSVQRIDIVLRQFENWHEFIKRDEDYVRSILGNDALPKEAAKTGLELSFAERVLGPTASRLIKIHGQRHTKEIWWTADRDMIENLWVAFAADLRTEPQSRRLDAFRTLTKSVYRLWFDRICVRLHEPQAACEIQSVLVIGAMEELGQRLAANPSLTISDAMRPYGRLLVAWTLFLAEEDASAFLVLDPWLANATREVASGSGKAITAERLHLMIMLFRANTIYATLLQKAVSQDPDLQDNASVIKWYRAVHANWLLGEMIISQGRWAQVRWRMEQEASRTGPDGPCRVTEGLDALSRRFLLAHVANANNLIHIAPLVIEYASERGHLPELRQMARRLADYPLPCLVGDAVISSQNVDALTRAILDSRGSLHFALARRAEETDAQRREDACIAKSAYVKALNRKRLAYREQPMPDRYFLGVTSLNAVVDAPDPAPSEDAYAAARADLISSQRRADRAARYHKQIDPSGMC